MKNRLHIFRNRSSIKVLVLFFFSVLSFSTAQQKPNVLLINIDDMGWKDVGFMGSDFYETPNIDALSAAGMVFNNGYTSAANCAPSRACLLTGLWPQRHGVFTVGSSQRGNKEDRKIIPIKNTRFLSNKFKVIPQYLKEVGYNTYHIGKWHISKNPKDFGFDVNIGGSDAGFPKSYFPPYKNIDVQGSSAAYLTDVLSEKAVTLMTASKESFFMYYATYAVHLPINPIPELVPKYLKRESKLGQTNGNYASMVENLDKNIGVLIKGLEDAGKFENTIIIFTSDNGGLYGITSQKPLRSGKGSYYEGGIKVPFFFVWQNKISKNTRSDFPISNMDILPTILSLTSNGNNKNIADGADLSSLLLHRKNLMERPLFWHFPIYLQSKKWKGFVNENRDPLFRTRPGSAVRLGDWKLIYYYENDDLELFNLKEDVSETENIAKLYPAKALELTRILKKWCLQTGAPIPKELNKKYNFKSDKNIQEL